MLMPAPCLPDYGGGSIVNLMVSLASACGAPDDGLYPELQALPASRLTGFRNIVLLVIDGLGADTLARLGQGGFLHRHQIANLTSVFPSTTASAATCLLNGQAPQQHGLTGWHMHFREIGCILAVLPLVARHGGPSLRQCGMDPTPLLTPRSLFSRIRRQGHVLSPSHIVNSDFNLAFTSGAQRIGYQGADACFAAIPKILAQSAGQNYLHAYYPTLDSLAHQFGIASPEVAACFAKLDAAFGELLSQLAGSDTAVLVSADHGFIDIPAHRRLDLADFPELAETLVLPLCGERRAAWCYVHPERTWQFEKCVAEQLADMAWLYRSDELISRNWFGRGPAHPRLAQRIGDYALIMKDDWTLADALPGEKVHTMIGVHGGVSPAEMAVPLVFASP